MKDSKGREYIGWCVSVIGRLDYKTFARTRRASIGKYRYDWEDAGHIGLARCAKVKLAEVV